MIEGKYSSKLAIAWSGKRKDMYSKYGDRRRIHRWPLYSCCRHLTLKSEPMLVSSKSLSISLSVNSKPAIAKEISRFVCPKEFGRRTILEKKE